MSETQLQVEKRLDERDAGKFIRAYFCARRLGLPTKWFMSEAKAGRIPHLVVGCQLMFSVEQVREALLKRAAGPAITPKSTAASGEK